MIDFLIRYDLSNSAIQFVNKPANVVELKSEGVILELWGDPVNYKEFRLSSSTTAKDIIETITGHFYYLLWDSQQKKFTIGNSIFGILPVYYACTGSSGWISNDPLSIADRIVKPVISKRFILENVLFNYPLFNHSCFENVQLLPVNSCIANNGAELKINELFRIEELFVKDPLPVGQSAEHIARYFLKRIESYFPNEMYAVSLTGGFDGRTLAAASLYYHKKFLTFSFGTEESKDVYIPMQLAKIAGVKYTHINLDQSYVAKSLEFGTNFIINSSGTASFSRGHYLYAATKLKDEANYIVTGNFGSELFRAAHIAGVLISPNLVELFKAPDYETALKTLGNSNAWGALNRSEFEKEWKSLCEDIKKLSCFNTLYSDLTKNQQFSVILFNEVIRKYFGPEIVNQFKIIKNRTPFLDLEFIKELFKTELAGVYSDFFTNDPLKRFKGQITYAHIIKHAFPTFGKIVTDKGYKPDSILSWAGRIEIVIAFLGKKLRKQKTEGSDHHKVDAAFEKNRNLIESDLKEHPYFNSNFIKNGLTDKLKSRDSYFITLSQIWWLNYLQKKIHI